MSKNITLKFISEQAGYSPSTVFRVMNGNVWEYRISEIAFDAIIDHIDGIKDLSEWSNKMMDTQIIKRKSISVK